MANSKKLSELTLEELYIEKKKRKGILTGLGIVMLIACVIMIVVAVKSENYVLIAVACGVFVTLMPLMASLNEVEKEIKNRQQK